MPTPNQPSAVMANPQMTSSDHESNRTFDGSGQYRLKRVFDILIVVCVVFAALPLLASIVMMLLVMQGRPVFITHFRVGRGGRRFPCLKFRTMVKDSDAALARYLAESPSARREWEATRKLKSDPRVTPLGRVLRKSSVDELPQLINVLRGEMSLVGPRPIVDAEVGHYGASIHHYCRVRPGLTGLWQISGRSDVSYKTRVELDVDYVTNWSFAQDLLIIAKTIPAVVSSRGSY